MQPYAEKHLCRYCRWSIYLIAFSSHSYDYRMLHLLCVVSSGLEIFLLSERNCCNQSKGISIPTTGIMNYISVINMNAVSLFFCSSKSPKSFISTFKLALRALARSECFWLTWANLANNFITTSINRMQLRLFWISFWFSVLFAHVHVSANNAYLWSTKQEMVCVLCWDAHRARQELLYMHYGQEEGNK